MDELARRRLFQINKDAAHQQADGEKVLGAMLGSLLAQKWPSHLDSPSISPTTLQALQLLARLRTSSCASRAPEQSAWLHSAQAWDSEARFASKTAQDSAVKEPTAASRQPGGCLPLDKARPFCQCKYRRVWLPRDVKTYQVNERSERYFNCVSMTYELRKYYEHRFSDFGLSIFKLNIFIDDKGNMYGIVERNGTQASGQELKFNLIIRNTDSNEFISHEGLVLPSTDASFHFAFRVEQPLFDSYFIERKLIRGKYFTCSLIVERSHVHSSKKYFK